MLCQRSSRSFAALFQPSRIQRAARKSHTTPSLRKYTTLPPLRPSLSGPLSPPRQIIPLGLTHPTSSSDRTLDLVPKISAHPALSGLQMRCGPRNTFSPSHFVRKRRHGFLSRARTRKGRATLLRRKLKGRSTLSH